MTKAQGLAMECLLVLAMSAGLLAQAEADPPAFREYDVADIVGQVSNAKLILRPQGALVFLEPGNGTNESPDGMPTFGFLEDPSQPKPLVYPYAAYDSTFVDQDHLASILSDRLVELGVDLDQSPPTISWAGSSLRIRAPQAVQDAIGNLLSDLEETASAVISVECLLVPLDVMDGKAPSWRADGPVLDESVFEAAVLDPRSRLLTVLARNGQRAASATKKIQPLVVDEKIDQSGVIPVTNPVIEAPPAGERLEVSAFRIPGGGAVRVEMTVGRFRVTARKATPGLLWGDLELPDTEETLISASTVLVPGKAVVVGSLEDREPQAALLRARVSSPLRLEAIAAGGESRRLGAYDVSVLVRSLQEGSLKPWPHNTSTYRLRSAEPRLVAEFVRQAVPLSDEDRLLWQGPYFFLSATTQAHREVARILGEEWERASRLVALDLEILSLSREAYASLRAAADGALVLRQGWAAALDAGGGNKRRRFSLACIPGQVHALHQAVLKTYVVGVSNVSGGTGFAIVESSDPLTAACGEGVELRLRADLPSSGGVRLQLEGGETMILDERQVTVAYPAIPYSAGAGESREPVPNARPADVVKKMQLTLPRQGVQYWSATLNAPQGRDVILHAAAATDDGRATVIVGRAREVR